MPQADWLRVHCLPGFGSKPESRCARPRGGNLTVSFHFLQPALQDKEELETWNVRGYTPSGCL